MRVAITGAGTVSPIGTDAAHFWASLLDGSLGIRRAPWVDPADDRGALFAAVTDAFDPTRVMDARLLDGTDRFVSFGIDACDQALRAAGLLDEGEARLDPLRTAVVDGTSMGGMYSLMHAQWLQDTQGPDAVPPKTMLRIWANMTGAQLCMRHSLHGPSYTVTTACASALDAIGQAARLVDAGVVDVALCGGTEGGFPRDRTDRDGFVPVTSTGGAVLGMETPERDPQRAMRPFDVERSGIVFGEGAAWFVLESEDHARRRGATPLGWLRGYGSCADAFHPSAPAPDGRWEAHAMQLAITDAGCDPAAVDAVIAHGTSTPKGDAAEVLAIARAVPRADLLVTSIKGNTGHTGASSGGMGLLAALGALRDGVLPPTRGTRTLDADVPFDVVLDRPRPHQLSTVQVNAFGFGGQNASVVVATDP